MFNIILEGELSNIKRISRQVLKYFETFTQNIILAEKKLLTSSKWCYQLMISITNSDFSYIEQAGYRNFISEKKKLYIAFVSPALFKNKTNEKDIAEFVFECICKFLLNNFRKIDRQYLEKKKELIDWNYLLSIPYPAPEDEVEYLGVSLKEYKAMFQ